jgi:protein ImuB
MRTFCLNLQKSQEPHCAELFIALTPRVQFRAPHFIFADIESTSGLFGGEDRLLSEGLRIGRKLSPMATAAIADHPNTAQVLSHFQPQSISDFGEDQKTFSKFSISRLTEFEGLNPWSQRRTILTMIETLHSLGFETFADLFELSLSSLRERWGETGALLWRRLHGLDAQALNVLLPTEILRQDLYFDDYLKNSPLQNLQLLAKPLHQSLEFLFLRLQNRGRFAQNLELTLHCEYSKKIHQLKIEPVTASRDLKLFFDLILQRLEKIDFQNPIRHIEIAVHDVPEKVLQMDFFETRDMSQERWQRLISFAKQSDLKIGFLEPQAKHFPEDSFQLKADWPELLKVTDKVLSIDQAIQIKSVYAKGLQDAPRPTLLLKDPELISKQKMQRYQKLSFFPTERIEASWWKKAFSENPPTDRDYYFALSSEGELTWIFQNKKNQNYYLHGYFD